MIRSFASFFLFPSRSKVAIQENLKDRSDRMDTTVLEEASNLNEQYWSGIVKIKEPSR